MKYAPHSRIGIIGAGAAGLMAAETLRTRGYTDVTVLERSERAGGKCLSINHEGRSYELGAGVISSSSRDMLDLAKKYDVPMQLVDFSARLYLDADTGQPMKRTVGEMLRLLWQVVRYHKLARTYRALLEPGYSNVPPELSIPFALFAKEQGIELLAEELAKYFTGFGYGFFEDVPAAYVFKYYPWDIVFAYFKQTFYKFPGGIQGLWTTVARAHRVEYGVEIGRIERGSSVEVTTNRGVFTFDALIIASPLDEALRYLDPDEEERELFRAIQWCDYRTYACRLSGFPKTTGYVPKNFQSHRLGHPVFWYQRYTDSDLYTFYCFGDWKMSDEEVMEHIGGTVRQLGGTMEELVRVERWKYFPHISPESMRSGFFDRVEAKQGQRGTYYAGEVMNFSSVAHTADYSKHLVERFF